MLPQLVLLPPLGHKETIGTLGYDVSNSFKTEGLVRDWTFVKWQKDTQTRLYNIDQLIHTYHV